MKKIVRKVFAFTLAMVLCLTQLALPAMADSTTPDPSAGGSLPAPQAIAPDTPLPVAPTDSYDSDHQVVNNPDGTVTEILEEEWVTSETDTDTPKTETPNPDTTVDTTGNTVTTKTGEQTTTTNYGPDSSSQSVVGEENIEITDTTKTVTTETNVEMTNTEEEVASNTNTDDSNYKGNYDEYSSVSQRNPSETNPDKDDKSAWVVDGVVTQTGEGSYDVSVPEPDEVILTMTQKDRKDEQMFIVPIQSIVPDEGLDENNQPYENGATVDIGGEDWTVKYVYETRKNPVTGIEEQVVTHVSFTKISPVTEGSISWNSPTFEDPANAKPDTTTLKSEEYAAVTPSYTADEGQGSSDAGQGTVNVTLPEIKEYKAGTYTTDSDGNPLRDSEGREVKRTIVEIHEDNDPAKEVIGYEITDEIVQTGIFGTQVKEETKQTTTDDIAPVKPTLAPTTTQNGLTTKEVLSEIKDANGNITAYRVTKTITDAVSGKLYYTETHDYFGGTRTTQESSVTTPETGERTIKVVTTVMGKRETMTSKEETVTGSSTDFRTVQLKEYELISNGNGIYLKYQGELYEVVGSTALGINGANANFQLLEPNMGFTPSGGTGSVNTSTDLRVPTDRGSVGDTADGYVWQYFDYGLESRIKVDYGNSEEIAHQFILKDAKGNKVYAYCMDLSTSAKHGYSYDMDNVVDSGYTNEDDAKHIEQIALNGYWGVKGDAGDRGSLAFVKKFLTDYRDSHKNDSTFANLSDNDINTLSGGLAITATQAALWYYGHSDPNKVDDDEMVKNMVGNVYGTGISAQEKEVANALFRALIGQSIDNYDIQATEMLDEDNFATSVTMEIDGKVTQLDDSITEVYGDTKAVTDANGNITGYTDSKGNDLYKANMTFTVDVKQSDLTGNLTLKVVDENGHTLATKTLATDGSNWVGKLIAGEAVSSYTFENLTLANGVKVTLSIDGVQNLDEGAYLYSAAGGFGQSQTFVAVAEGKQDVHLSVDMKFTVTDPDAEVQWSEKKWQEKDVDTFERTEVGQKDRTFVETSTTVTVSTNVKGTKVSTKLVTEKLAEERKWESYIEYLYTTVRDEDGGGNGGENGLDIPDEAVPLAAAPKTGDASQILAIVCLVSMAGAWLLSKKEVQY